MDQLDAEALAQFNMDTLVQLWYQRTIEIQEAEATRFEVEKAMTRRMEANHAALHRLETEDGQIVESTFAPKTEYDQSVLNGLKEFLSPEDWDALLTNPSPPERKVNLVKLKARAKFGNPWKAIMDKAERKTPSMLTVKVKRTVKSK